MIKSTIGLKKVIKVNTEKNLPNLKKLNLKRKYIKINTNVLLRYVEKYRKYLLD